MGIHLLRSDPEFGFQCLDATALGLVAWRSVTPSQYKPPAPNKITWTVNGFNVQASRVSVVPMVMITIMRLFTAHQISPEHL